MMYNQTQVSTGQNEKETQLWSNLSIQASESQMLATEDQNYKDEKGSVTMWTELTQLVGYINPIIQSID